MKRRDFVLGSVGTLGAGLSLGARSQNSPCPPPMLQAAGGSSSATACDASIWTPPYVMPGPGEVRAIGVNTHHAITPAGWSTAAWDGANFHSYGGGTFVPTFSRAGAYVIAGSGGHNHSDNVHGVAFDFETALWSRLDNANGVKLRPAGGAIHDSMTNGAPYFETLVDTDGNPAVGGAPTAVPAPPHPYGNLVYVPEGQRGSVVYFGRAAVAVGARSSGGIHRFDLHTRLWSRYSTALNPRISVDSGCVYDPQRNRVWHSETYGYSGLLYLDLADKQVKTAGSFTTPSSVAYITHLVLHDGLLVAIGNGTNEGAIHVVDPDNPTGWSSVRVSGSLPTSGGGCRNRWVRYSNGNYYWLPRTGGNTVWRLRPPPNPLTGTWQVDTVTVSGPAMGFRWDSNAHYTLLCYVPVIDCLAWIPGGNLPVYIFRPT